MSIVVTLSCATNALDSAHLDSPWITFFPLMRTQPRPQNFFSSLRSVPYDEEALVGPAVDQRAVSCESQESFVIYSNLENQDILAVSGFLIGLELIMRTFETVLK